jgi:hypothetical protein
MPLNFGPWILWYVDLHVCLRTPSRARHHANAYLPHLIALGAGVGYMLAMREMRTVLATRVGHFDIQFTIGCEPEDWPVQLKD